MSLLYITQASDPALLRAFTDSGHKVLCAGFEDTAWALAAGGYSYILLDLAVPDPALLQQCLAGRGAALVLVLLEHNERQARIDVLRAGADLCLARPVAFVELQARMAALSRQHLALAPREETRLWLSPSRLLLGRGKRQQSLTVSEHRLLAVLARHPGAVSRQAIEQQLWGVTDESRTALIERHVCNLRRKLSELDAPNALQTLRGFGYSLRETVQLRTD